MAAFSGKTIYITGGSSGIGLALGKLLASLGASILMLARSVQGLEAAREKVVRERQTQDQRIGILPLDVGEDAQVRDKLADAVLSFGPPDILILSAGINSAANHFEQVSPSAFAHEIKVNVSGVRNPIQTLLPALKARKGQVVILSSAAALFGMFGYTTYAASKAALVGFAESLRYELAPLGMGVCLVCPPEVDTPMNLGEAATLPVQARAVKSLSGLLTPEFTAREILKGMRKNRFMIIPGRKTRFLYLVHRLTNGGLTRLVADWVIQKAQKGGK